jgi:hypothetical protein
MASVLAEAQWDMDVLAEWVFSKLSITLGAKVKGPFLIKIALTKLFAFFHSAEYLVEFREMIGIVFQSCFGSRVEMSFYFHFDNKSQFLAGKNVSFTAVAAIANHRMSLLVE